MTGSNTPIRGDRRILFLVSANFAMLFILFCLLGYLLWQSIRLVETLQDDLRRAEQSVAALKERVDSWDAAAMSERIMSRVAEGVRSSVAVELGESNLAERLETLSRTANDTRENLEKTGQSIQQINEKLRSVDTELLAERVSYHILKGLGDGFTAAAESRSGDSE